MAVTMFERYGGFASVSRIVSALYDKVLDSAIMSPYFADIDMRRLIDHQTKFIASLMGGPASYTNEALERAHANLNIDEPAFGELAMLLRETLEDFDVAEDDIEHIERCFMDRKRFIVTRRSA